MDTFNPSQMPPQMAPINNQPVKKSVGPLIAVIIILALIIVGGLYFLKMRAAQPTYTPPTPQAVVEQKDVITASLNQQSKSDELSSIESDLNSTDLNNLDEGAAAVEAQLQ